VIKAVIFDLDGTLVHLPVDYEKLFKEFKRIMKTNNIKPITQTIANLDEKTRKEVFRKWNAAELRALPKMIIKKEGIELYQKFSPKPKALVTMQGRTVVERILETIKLSFVVTITRELSLDRTQQLEEATKKLGVQLHEILFIGDTENDENSARKLGCQFIKVK
jgi:HAD superfamily hydrolase (TIGR01549 family)